jgi:hypothetical protein
VRAELRLKTTWSLAYNVFGFRVPHGGMKTKVLKEDEGHVEDMLVWVDGVDPVIHEPHAPPIWRQSPCLLVILQGMRVKWSRDQYVWWYTRDWNQVAVNLARVRSYARKSRRRVKDVEVAEGLEGEEAAASLYRFVRDELLDIPAHVYTKKPPTVDDVLKYRTGDEKEKAYTLQALLDRHGVRTKFFWAHNPEDGRLFQDYPSRFQIDIPLLRAEFDGKERWYDIGCGTCAPGEIRPSLWGTYVMGYKSNVIKLDQRFMEEARDYAMANHETAYHYYFTNIQDKNWCDWRKAPGDPMDQAGSTSVMVSLDDPTGSTGSVSIESVGSTSLRRDLHRQKNAEAVVGSWASTEFEDLGQLTLEGANAANADTFRADLSAKFDPLPKPMGDTWVLPAALIYGHPVVGEWPDERKSPFYVEESVTDRWELRIPLPEGWEHPDLPSEQILGANVFLYHVTYHAIDGELQITRELIQKRCVVGDHDALVLLGQRARSIHELEESPLVVHNKGTSQ